MASPLPTLIFATNENATNALREQHYFLKLTNVFDLPGTAGP